MQEKNLDSWLRELRREFHRYPEPGWLEYQTTVRILQTLEQLQIPVQYGCSILSAKDRKELPDRETDHYWFRRAGRRLDRSAAEYMEKLRGGFTGAIACIRGRQPGSVVTLRFDMDANRLEESEEPSHRPARMGFSSQNKGAMHGCGHDGHIAVGLGAARLLKEQQQNLSGTVYLLFQPAEEGVRGAGAFLQSSCIREADYFLSGHIGLRADKSGMFAASVCGFLATTKWTVEFSGQASHAGASAESGRSALTAAAAAVLRLEELRSQSDGSYRLNIGTFHSGTARNIVAEKALLGIETRGTADAADEYIAERMKEVCQQTALEHGCSCQIRQQGTACTAECDTELRELIYRFASKTFPQAVKELPFAASEDAAVLMREVQRHGGQACYMLFGSDLAGYHHSNRFDFDEAMLAPAARLYADIAALLLR